MNQKIAKAMCNLDWILLEMGDSLSEIVENVIFKAEGIYPEESLYNKGHEELLQMLEHAYQTLAFKHPETIDEFLQWRFDPKKGDYGSCIINLLAGESSTNIENSETYRMMVDIKEYVEEKKLDAKDLVNDIIKKMETYHLDTIHVAYSVAHSYWKKLDKDLFGVQTNSCATVGSMNTEYGDYEYSFMTNCNKLESPKAYISTRIYDKGKEILFQIGFDRIVYVAEGCISTMNTPVTFMEFRVIKGKFSNEDIAQKIANVYGEAAKKLKEMANKTPSLYSCLPINGTIEKELSA